jgi:hypothetical protein
MLGWLRTAGLTASVGGQECVSDGFSIGRSPQTPRGPRKQQYLEVIWMLSITACGKPESWR